MQTNRPHHATTVASDPRGPVRSGSGLPGLRFVERTVDADGAPTSHCHCGVRTEASGAEAPATSPEGGRTE